MNIIEAIKKINPNINRIVYWETKPDGSNWDNPEDGLIWEDKQYERPSWDEIMAQVAVYDLQQAKIQKASYINSCRKAEQYTNITVNNKEYLNTETAQNKFFNLLSATTGDIDWLSADGTWTTLTREEANQVRDAIILKEKSAYQKESDLQLQIKNAITVEEINLIEW